jgi:leader peptidase (prepilin peptidase)/N-methyltransferase
MIDWAPTGVTALAGGLTALAVSPVLAGWTNTLAAGTATRWWRPRVVSPAQWVTTAVPAALLGAVAAVLAPPVAWWLLGAGGAVLAVVDARTHRLPARFVHPLAAVVTAVLAVSAAVTGAWPDLARAVVAALLVGAVWLAVALVSPAAVGMGDIRVSALTAALLGWQGWPAVLLGQLLASILGVITAAAMLAAGRRRAGYLRVPMGPALIGGAFLAAMIS